MPASLGKVSVGTRGNRTGYDVASSTPLYVATRAVLQHYGIDPSVLHTGADIITSRTNLGALVVVSPRGRAPLQRANTPTRPVTPAQWHPTIKHVHLPAYTSDPITLLTPHALASFQLQSVPAGWLVETPHALTRAEITAAERAAAAAGISVESRPSQTNLTQLRDDATAIGILVVLGVLSMTVGLIRSETASDLRTLTAAGASSTTRRNITAATAGSLAFLGAFLGIAVRVPRAPCLAQPRPASTHPRPHARPRRRAHRPAGARIRRRMAARRARAVGNFPATTRMTERSDPAGPFLQRRSGTPRGDSARTPALSPQ